MIACVTDLHGRGLAEGYPARDRLTHPAVDLTSRRPCQRKHSSSSRPDSRTSIATPDRGASIPGSGFLPRIRRRLPHTAESHRRRIEALRGGFWPAGSITACCSSSFIPRSACSRTCGRYARTCRSPSPPRISTMFENRAPPPMPERPRARQSAMGLQRGSAAAPRDNGAPANADTQAPGGDGPGQDQESGHI